MKLLSTSLLFVLSTAQAASNFDSMVFRYYKQLQSEVLTEQNCPQVMGEILENLTEEKLQGLTESTFNASSADLSQKLWLTRLKIHDQLKNLKSCKESIHDVFVRIRYIEDLIALKTSKVKRMNPEDVSFFKEDPAFVAVNAPHYGYQFKPGYNLQNFDFKSGDLMATRGVTFFSSALTRIPNLDGQFSHFVLIQVDEKAGKGQSTIESYAQTGGVSIFDMTYALQNENARILVLRPRDLAVGAKASELIVKKVQDLAAQGKKIPYDYFMDVEDPSTMTCAEVAHWSYRWASNDLWNIPETKSTITPDLKKFMQDTGMTKPAVLAPKDLELDSRFEIIAEFKDYRILRDMIYRDVITSKIYEWMIKDKYELNHGFISLMAGVIFSLRETPLWPLIKRLGAPDIPEGTPYSFYSTIAKLRGVADVLYDQLEEVDQKFENRNGWPMTTGQLGHALENLRQKDLEKFIHGDQSESLGAWHNMFRNPMQRPLNR